MCVCVCGRLQPLTSFVSLFDCAPPRRRVAATRRGSAALGACVASTPSPRSPSTLPCLYRHHTFPRCARPFPSPALPHPLPFCVVPHRIPPIIRASLPLCASLVAASLCVAPVHAGCRRRPSTHLSFFLTCVCVCAFERVLARVERPLSLCVSVPASQCLCMIVSMRGRA